MNFRPFSDEELRNNAPQVVTCNDYQREVAVSQNIAGKHFDRVFVFDKVSFTILNDVQVLFYCFFFFFLIFGLLKMEPSLA